MTKFDALTALAVAFGVLATFILFTVGLSMVTGMVSALKASFGL